MKICTLLFALALPLACAAADAPPPVDTAHRIVLVVDEIAAVRNFPVVLADRLGYLRDGAFAVTVMNVRPEAWHGDMLADGRVDAVMAYYHHNIVNQSQGRMTEAIVTLGVTPGAKVLVANRARASFGSAAALKGSRIIAGGAGSSKTTLANYLLVAEGHGIGDYTRLPTGGKERNLQALRDGSADLIIAPTPDAGYYETQGVASVYADLTTVAGTRGRLGMLFPSSTVFMNSAAVKAHPEFAQHLATAFVRTLRFINSHSAEEIAALIPDEIVGKGQDRAAYLEVLREAMPMFATDGRMPADGAAGELAVLAQANPKLAAVKPELTWTNRFVDAALRKAP
jgi:NitT/TauT family transport system substrate-binding protein